jgi:hypothetical protein
MEIGAFMGRLVHRDGRLGLHGTLCSVRLGLNQGEGLAYVRLGWVGLGGNDHDSPFFFAFGTEGTRGRRGRYICRCI